MSLRGKEATHERRRCGDFLFWPRGNKWVPPSVSFLSGPIDGRPIRSETTWRTITTMKRTVSAVLVFFAKLGFRLQSCGARIWLKRGARRIGAAMPETSRQE